MGVWFVLGIPPFNQRSTLAVPMGQPLSLDMVEPLELLDLHSALLFWVPPSPRVRVRKRRGICGSFPPAEGLPTPPPGTLSLSGWDTKFFSLYLRPPKGDSFFPNPRKWTPFPFTKDPGAELGFFTYYLLDTSQRLSCRQTVGETFPRGITEEGPTPLSWESADPPTEI